MKAYYNYIMFNLDDCVAYIGSNAIKKISEKLNDILVEKGSTRVQWIALYYISKNRDIIQSDLAKLMNIKTPTIVRLIDRLEKESLVCRNHDKNDRRIIRLSCTSKGEALNQTLLPLGEDFSDKISDDITTEELMNFKTVLDKLVRNMESIDEKI